MVLIFRLSSLRVNKISIKKVYFKTKRDKDMNNNNCYVSCLTYKQNTEINNK